MSCLYRMRRQLLHRVQIPVIVFPVPVSWNKPILDGFGAKSIPNPSLFSSLGSFAIIVIGEKFEDRFGIWEILLNIHLVVKQV